MTISTSKSTSILLFNNLYTKLHWHYKYPSVIIFSSHWCTNCFYSPYLRLKMMLCSLNFIFKGSVYFLHTPDYANAVLILPFLKLYCWWCLLQISLFIIIKKVSTFYILYIYAGHNLIVHLGRAWWNSLNFCNNAAIARMITKFLFVCITLVRNRVIYSLCFAIGISCPLHWYSWYLCTWALPRHSWIN